MKGPKRLEVRHLGRIAYDAAWALQRELAEARSTDRIPDTLLWVEHPPTFTLGSGADPAHLLLSPDDCAARGITVHRVDRGGDITYHGPGQLVGYPILRLPPGPDGQHPDVIGYVRALEQTLIDGLAAFDVRAKRLPGFTGVWVDSVGHGEDSGPAKIAAIGVRVTAGRITQHGLALNVTTDLDAFAGIVPCGIPDKPVTSLARLTGQQFPLETVAGALESAFRAIFGDYDDDFVGTVTAIDRRRSTEATGRMPTRASRLGRRCEG